MQVVKTSSSAILFNILEDVRYKNMCIVADEALVKSIAIDNYFLSVLVCGLLVIIVLIRWSIMIFD